MNHQQRAEEVVQGWLVRLMASPLYKKIYNECECSEWDVCQHDGNQITDLDKGAAQENADSIMLSELGQALGGDYGLARHTLNTIKARFIKFCHAYNISKDDVDIVAKVHEIEVEEITKALKLVTKG